MESHISATTAAAPTGQSPFSKPLKDADAEAAPANKPQNITLSQLSAALEKTTGKQTLIPNTASSESDFDPHAIEKQIYDSVSNALKNRADSPLARQSIIAQAREGVAQGIDEAKNILSSLGKLSGKLNEKIDKAQTLVFESLDRLAAKASNAPQLKAVKPAPETSSQAIQAVTRTSNEYLSRQASIQIETRDGDLLTIAVSRSSTETSNTVNIKNGGQQLSAYENQRNSTFEFSYELQGTLDQGEQKAVADLLTDMNKLAEKFFNGDVQDSFKKALSLGMDGKELAAFSLDFNASRTSEVVSRYQTIESIQPERSAPVARIADAVAYGEELLQLLKQTATELPFNNPLNARANIYTLFIEQQSLAVNMSSNTNDLLNQLLNEFKL